LIRKTDQKRKIKPKNGFKIQFSIEKANLKSKNDLKYGFKTPFLPQLTTN
jgi:hypothetical protein